jgi:hypothetical protein
MWGADERGFGVTTGASGLNSPSIATRRQQQEAAATSTAAAAQSHRMASRSAQIARVRRQAGLAPSQQSWGLSEAARVS